MRRFYAQAHDHCGIGGTRSKVRSVSRPVAFASEVTQLLNHAQLVMQYIRQGTEVANELNCMRTCSRTPSRSRRIRSATITNDLNQLAGELFRAVRRSPTRWGILTNFTANVSRLRVQRQALTTRNTGTGRKRPWIPPWEHFAPRESQGQQLQSEQAVLNSRKHLSREPMVARSAARARDISEQQVEQLMKLRS